MLRVEPVLSSNMAGCVEKHGPGFGGVTENEATTNNNSNMPAIANSASAQSSMFPRVQALSMGSPKPQPASEIRAKSPASTTSESSTTSSASILSQQSMTASALFLGNKFI
ncbi:hypothetical protein HDU77_010949 [Chytriomyces hyalinus]|nr:hypothetical protein HDU77_010949 [Chytriomyces hyalinus]